MKKLIVKMEVDYGRMGSVDGLFVCTQEELDDLYDKDLYFGEILGKHSDVYFTIEKADLKVLTDDQDFIEKFISIMGDGTISGYNPLHALREDRED